MVPSTKRSHAYHRALALSLFQPHIPHLVGCHLVRGVSPFSGVAWVAQRSWFSSLSGDQRESRRCIAAVGTFPILPTRCHRRAVYRSDVGVVLLPVISQRLHQMQCSRISPFLTTQGRIPIQMDFSVHLAQLRIRVNPSETECLGEFHLTNSWPFHTSVSISTTLVVGSQGVGDPSISRRILTSSLSRWPLPGPAYLTFAYNIHYNLMHGVRCCVALPVLLGIRHRAFLLHLVTPNFLLSEPQFLPDGVVVTGLLPSKNTH